MTRNTKGWRSIRGASRSAAEDAPSRNGVELHVSPEVSQLAAPVSRRAQQHWLSGSIEWNLAYIGIIAYIFHTTTLRFPLGDISIATALVGMVFLGKRFRWPPLPLVIYLAYIAWSWLGYLSTESPEIVWPEIVVALKVWLIVLAAYNALRTRRQVHFFMLFFVVMYGLFPVRGTFLNFFFYHERLAGRAVWRLVFGNPNDLAAITLLILAILVALLVVERRKWLRVGLLVGAVVLPTLILMTQSRGAFVALAAGILLALTGERRRLRAFVIVAIIGAIAANIAPKGVWERVARLSRATSIATLAEVDPDGSAEQRFAIWKVGMEIARKNPIFGVGMGNYPHAHRALTRSPEYRRRVDYNPIANGMRDAHSTVINVLAETGTPGLMLFVAMIGVVFQRSMSVRKRWKAVLPDMVEQLRYLQVGLVTFLVAGIWGTFNGLSYFFVYLALMLAFIDLCERAGPQRKVPARSVSRPLRGTGVVVARSSVR